MQTAATAKSGGVFVMKGLTLRHAGDDASGFSGESVFGQL
jgi:hypothetical protein